MRPLRPGAALRRVLERIRDRDLAASVFGLGHDAALEAYRPELIRVLNDAGLPRVWYLHGRNLGLELLRLLRTRRGARLSRELELLARKWRNLGFDQEDLEQVLLGLLGRMLSGPPDSSFAIRTSSLPVTCPRPGVMKPGRSTAPHRYRAALDEGRVALKASSTADEQAARHRSAIERNRAVSGLVRDILRGRGIPGREFIRYNAFAYRVDRLARRRGGKSLQMAIADLVDRYEARGLDQRVLVTIRDGVLTMSERT